MSKKIISAVLVLIIVFTMLPTAIFAADVEYNLWVGDTRVTSANMANVLGDGTVSYTPAVDGTPQTLTLSGANITTPRTSGGYKYGIYSYDPLNIVLTAGSSNIIGGDEFNAGSNPSYGINTGSLSISGNGSLAVTSGSGNECVGIISGNINITGGAQVTATGGESTMSSLSSNGIRASVFTVDGESTNVTAIGGKAENSSNGIAADTINIYGGEVNANGGEANNFSNGISSLAVNIFGGTISSTGGAGSSSYGIYLYGSAPKISISGGTVIARFCQTAIYNFGVMSVAPNIDEDFNYQWRRNDDITFTPSSSEKYVYNASDSFLEIKPYSEPTTYTITLDANGGNALTPPTLTTKADGKLDSLPTPNRSGYSFYGWFTQASGGTAITTDSVFDKNTTIYAQWSPISGGDGSSGSDSSRDSSTSYTIGVVATGNLDSSIDVFVLTPNSTGKTNEVVDSTTYNQLRQSVESGYTPIAAFEVQASYSGNLTLSFPVGEQYNGMQFVVKHKTSSGKIETYTGTVDSGKVVITVNSLSPFMIAVKGVNKNPNTGR